LDLAQFEPAKQLGSAPHFARDFAARVSSLT